MADEVSTPVRKPRGEGRGGVRRQKAEARVRREGGAKRVEGAESGNRSEVTTRDLLFLIARASGGFEAILKTKEPALSLSQWAILEMLSKEQGGVARPSQIGKKLAFSRQHIRLAAKKLMKLELISAEAPEDGKKAAGLKISEPGRAQLAAIDLATEALAEALKSDKRVGGLNQAARTLKVLTSVIVAQVPKTRGKRDEVGDESETDADAG